MASADFYHLQSLIRQWREDIKGVMKGAKLIIYDVGLYQSELELVSMALKQIQRYIYILLKYEFSLKKIVSEKHCTCTTTCVGATFIIQFSDLLCACTSTFCLTLFFGDSEHFNRHPHNKNMYMM